MDKFKDFDKFFETQGDTEPLGFNYGGRAYDLPAQLPAMAGLRITKMMATGSSTVTGDDMETLLLALLGTEQMTALFESGISFEQMGEILKWMLQAYDMAGESGGDAGNAPAPEKAGGS